jgi:hypothetical protein
VKLPRCRAVMKWMGAGVAALLLGTWFASRWATPVFMRENAHYAVFEIWHGRFGVLWLRGSLDPSPGPGWHLYTEARTPGWDWDLQWSADAHSCLVLVPLYIPFTLLALPTAFLFHRDRRSVRWPREGRCVGCGYDLSGVSGKCPECGRVRP